MNQSWDPRPINTLEDVDSILGGDASFPELLDCARLSRALGHWDRVEQAAIRALEWFEDRRSRPRTILEAAELLVKAGMSRATSLDDVSAVATETRQRLDRFSGVRAEAEDLRLSLDEVALLIHDGTPASMVSLSSRLRRFERPDLALVASSRALDDPGTRAAALTTRGAALTDLERFAEAAECLEQASAGEETKYTANAFARLMLAVEQPERAVSYAQVSIQFEPDSPSGWALLASAAMAADNPALFEDAIARLEELGRDQPSLFDSPNRNWAVVLAARQLVNAGQLDEAEAAIKELDDYPPAVVLRKEIEFERRRRGRDAQD